MKYDFFLMEIIYDLGNKVCCERWTQTKKHSPCLYFSSLCTVFDSFKNLQGTNFIISLWLCIIFWCIFFDYVIINPFIYYIHLNYINKYLGIWKLNAFIVKYISFDTTTTQEKKLFLPSSLFWNMFFGQWIGMDRIRPDRIGLDLIWLAHALVVNNFFSPFGLYSFVDLSHFASANHVSFIYNT